MSFSFPEFSEPVALADGRRWTAAFDSYDQRNEDVYYVITLHADGEPVRFMAQAPLYWAGEDWSTPEFRTRLESELALVAKQGQSNTPYAGTMLSGC